VHRNEAVCFEKMEEFIKKVVRVVTYQLKKIRDVFAVKIPCATSKAFVLGNDVTSLTPKPLHTVPGTLTEATAV